MTYNPRDYADSRDELARDVLTHEEYREQVLDDAERARIRSLARQHRNQLMRAVDVWSDDYRGPSGGAA